MFNSPQISAQCGSLSFTSVLPVNPTILNCPNPNDGAITIIANQAALYSIDNGVTWQASAIFNNLVADSYRLKIKNILNCEIAYASNPIVLTNFSCIEMCTDNIDNDGDGKIDCDDSDCANTTNATISADKMAVCATGSIATITATGGGTYRWNTGYSTNVIQTMTAGLYTVTVTTGIGCTNITQIYIDSTWHNDTQFPITGMNEIVINGGGAYDQFEVGANGILATSMAAYRNCVTA